MKLTKKQRFLTALRRQVPDVVPVSPLIHRRFAHSVLGRSDWRAVFQVHQMIGSTHFRGPLWIDLRASFPQGWGIERREFEAQPDGRTPTETTLRTPARTMTWRRVSGMTPGDPTIDWTVEYPVKGPEDWRAWMALQEQWLAGQQAPDCTTLIEAIEVMGEEGVPSVGLPSAFMLAGASREMGNLLLDLHDYPDLLDAVLSVARQVMDRYVEAFVASPAEVAFLDICWATGANMGPRSFRRWALPDVLRAVEIVRRVPGKYLGLYTLGRIRDLLPMLVDAGVHFVESFEQSEGDITLAEAKARYGERICIMGNFDPLLLAFGTVQDARQETLRCLHEGMAGGGYVLVTGDEVPADAKLDNLRAMVETVGEFGRYG